MNENGRVAVLVEPRRIELRQERVPDAPAGGMIVRVRAALTDGTDLKAYRRGHPKMPMPTRFGHEFSGDVVSVGAGAISFLPGDAVACTHSAPCGHCYWCAIGEEELCETILSTMILGAYADYVVVPARVVARNAFIKPAGISYAEAAFLEPLSCVMHSVRLVAPHPGSVVAVVGDGGFGILHALVLARDGVRALLIGRRAERLALASDLGVETIDARAAGDREALLERTAGRGADALVECTGRAEVWERAPDLVRRGGIASFFGGLPGGTRVCFDAARLHYDRVRLIAPFHFAPQDVRAAFEAIERRAIPVARLVSHEYALDGIAEAFARLDAGEGMKMAIVP